MSMTRPIPDHNTGSHELDYEAVARGLEHGSFLLLGVIPRDVYADGHIPGSINLPLVEFDASLRQRFGDPDRPLLLYCMGFR